MSIDQWDWAVSAMSQTVDLAYIVSPRHTLSIKDLTPRVVIHIGITTFEGSILRF